MNSGMEPDIREFLVKVLNSIAMGLVFLLLNITLGIYFKLGIPEQGLSWYHILYYLFLLFSFFLLIRYYIRLWKN